MSRAAAAPGARSKRADSYGSRYSRPTTIINNRYYGGRGWGTWGWGMYGVGMWDMFFLSTASHMFWHHHWHDRRLRRALYEENLLEKEELGKLEARVKELEAQGVKRDPNYLPDDVDPDLAYSKEYVEQHPDEFYSEAEKESGGGLWSLLSLGAIGFLFYTVFVRRF